MPLPVRRAYAGAAPACTLSSDINSSATSFSITGTTTNWPTTATGPFYMVIDPGLSTEEKVLVGARTTGSLSSVTRAVDGTTASAHVAGATCYPVFTAVDANEANLLASTLTTKGDLLSTDGSDPKRVAVGSNNTRLVADSAQTSGIKWVADTQNTVIDAKGDLLVGSAADTVARLAVGGTNGQALVVDSSATNGVAWAETGGLVYITQLTYSATTSANIDNCFSSTYDNYLLVNTNYGSANSAIKLKYRAGGVTNSGNVYYTGGIYFNPPGSSGYVYEWPTTGGHFLGNHGSPSTEKGTQTVTLYDPYKAVKNTLFCQWESAQSGLGGFNNAVIADTTLFDGFALVPISGTITGTVRVYGYRQA